MNDLMLGWALGLISSLVVGVVLFALQSWRDDRLTQQNVKQNDIRLAQDLGSVGGKSFRNCDLSGANYSGKDFSGFDFESANLGNASFWATKLDGANLRGANLRKIRTKRASFRGADLWSTDFTGASLVKCDFSGAKMRKTKLSRVARIEDCVWNDVDIDDETDISDNLRQEIERQRSNGLRTNGQG